MNTTQAHVNGAPADAQALLRFARAGYGHFTTMQARAGMVRGFDLHCTRLVATTRALFDADFDVDALRISLRLALAHTPDASLRISVIAGNYSARAMPSPAHIDTLVLVDPPAPEPTMPVRLKSFTHERHLPQFKHLGNFDVFHLRRQALVQGFDDAVFCTREGLLSEGPTFSLGFFADDALVWTLAPQLDGVTRQLLRQAHRAAGGHNEVEAIKVADLARFDGGFCCHSGGIWPIAAIDGMALPENPGRMKRLHALLDDTPAQPI